MDMVAFRSIILLFSFFKIFIVIQLQLYAFSPHHSTPPQLNPSPSPTFTLPLDFVHVSFIVVPIIPVPHHFIIFYWVFSVIGASIPSFLPSFGLFKYFQTPFQFSYLLLAIFIWIILMVITEITIHILNV